MASISVAGDSSGSITIAAPAVAGSGTLTLPVATDTLVGKATTDTLTNKSIAATQLTGTIAASALPAGSVLQVVQTVKTNSFSTSTASFIDITGLSVSITPQSASNKILVSAIIYLGVAAGNSRFNLVRGSTNIAQSTSGTANQTLMGNIGGAYNGQTLPILFYDSPATTSATTYKIQFNAEGSAMTIGVRATDNYYGGICTITVMEIAG